MTNAATMDIDTVGLLAHRFRDALERAREHNPLYWSSSFPRGACQDASLLLGAYLVDSGISGFQCILAERGIKGEGTWETHAWLAKGTLVIDITADQYETAPAAVIVSSHSNWHENFFSISEAVPADFREYGLPELVQLYDRLMLLLNS